MAKDKETNRPDQELPNETEQQAAAQGEAPEGEQAELGLSPEAAKLKKVIETRYVRVRNIRIELKSGYVLRKVGQAFMVMPTGPRMKDYEGMITLNETGAFLFKEMEKPDASEESLIAACKAEYNATDEEAAQAVDFFIQQCADCGLMEYQDMILDQETGETMTKEEFDAKQREQQ